MNIYHETISLKHTYDASPKDVFSAYTNIEMREKWSAPNDDVLVKILESDVRTGGSEISKCGTKGAMNYVLTLNYHLVESDRLIMFTEELREGECIISVALITFYLQKNSTGGTDLCLTDQVTSFIGKDGAKGHQHGYSQALTNLRNILL